MAVTLRTIGREKPVIRQFVGRLEERKAFWARYDLMNKEGSTLINFYGAGGVGKSRLLSQLVEEIDRRRITYKNVFKNTYVLYHDFVNGTDKRAILNQWKNELEKFGCEFPFFETGDFYLSLKLGAKNVDKPQVKSWLEKNKWMSRVQNELNKAEFIADDVIPGLNAASAIADFPVEALGIFPGVKSLTSLVGFVNGMLSKRETNKKLAENASLSSQINKKFSMRNSKELEDFLPVLFAQDISIWAGSEKNFIIFLDTYELLTSEGKDSQLTANNLLRDWWIRDDEGLIFTMPPTLWVIAGRNELQWGGELQNELEQHLLLPFNQEDANKFLEDVGVENSQHRAYIINLTAGYPIYLDECAKTYREKFLDCSDKADLDIELFSQSRGRVINRLLKYLENNDGARTMIETLSILRNWTDRGAHAVIANFNYNTYIRAKNFSFIQPQIKILDGEKQEIFQLDSVLQSVIFQYTKEHEELNKLIVDTTFTMNSFVKKLNEQNRSEEAKFIQSRIDEMCREFDIKLDAALNIDTNENGDKKISYDKNFVEEKADESIFANLHKGQKIYLAKGNPNLNELLIQVDWQTDFDMTIDTSAFLLGTNGKVADDGDFIFYNNAKHASECIEYLEENRIAIELLKIPADIKKVAITLTIYDASERGQSFSQIFGANIHIIDPLKHCELVHFNFGENLSIETAIVIGELYFHKGEWKFNAIGAGFKGGLEALCKNFGVEVE